MKMTNFILIFLVGLFCFSGKAEETNVISPKVTDNEIYASVTWGATSTNGIRIGVKMYLTNSVGINPFTTLIYLCNTNSSVFFPIPPPHGYRLDLSLRDAGGKLVGKTKAGNALCMPVNSMVKAGMRIKKTQGAFFLLPNSPREYDEPFYLLDCFNVKEAGTYTLTVQGRLYRIISPTDLEPVALSETSIRVPIAQADLERYQASKKEMQ
jgi:hypothetical protein